MNNASYVTDLIAQQKAEGIALQLILFNAAKACVGWPYVYGAVGEQCKPAKRSQYGTKFYQKGHETIVTKCKAISWDEGTKTCKVTGSCSGCKWALPVLMTDCRGFVRKLYQLVYGFTIWGGTVGGQWNDDRNWKAKGKISDGIPKDTIVCLFVYNGSKWMHVGIGYNDETVESSSGVQYCNKRNKKWTHWAIAKCQEGDVPTPTPTPDPTPDWRPTIRKGSRNQYVKECQTLLQKLGYSLGICGIDGDYGIATEKAIREFQSDHHKSDGLVVDGVCGPMTWDALIRAAEKLDPPSPEVLYTVTIPGLTAIVADDILAKFPAATKTEERK